LEFLAVSVAVDVSLSFTTFMQIAYDVQAKKVLHSFGRVFKLVHHLYPAQAAKAIMTHRHKYVYVHTVKCICIQADALKALKAICIHFFVMRRNN